MIETALEYNRYSIAFWNFEKVIAFATKALTYAVDTIEYEALLLSAVVTYGCPFSKNGKGRANASASVSVKAFALSVEELKLHKRCMNLRNNALAHSAYEYNPTNLDAETGVTKSRPFSLVAHPFRVEALIALAEKLRDKCINERGDYVARTRQSGFVVKEELR